MSSFMDAADGRWREILISLGGVSSEQLTDRHQPCPACGGTDRFRWDSDEGRGSGYCNQCGGKDRSGGGMTGMDLLMRLRNWSFREAAPQVKQFLGIESVTDSFKRSNSAARPFRQAEAPPPDAAAPKLGRGAVAQWCYRDADGHQLFWVQRVNRSGGAKYFLLVIWLDGRWHTVTKRDPFRADWPEPRPLYWLPDLVARPDAPVVIAEGEKAVDAAAELLGENYVAVGFRNGAKSANKSDWSPLRGRRVVLLPDNDSDGAEFVQRVSRELRRVGVGSIAVCQPPEDAPEKWDIADGRDHDGWGPLDAELWIAGAVVQAEVVGPSIPDRAEPEFADAGDGSSEFPFSLLGYDSEGVYYYQPHVTGQVVPLGRGSHTSTNLVALAPLMFWEGRYPGERSGVDWLAAASELFTRQQKVGIFDPEKIRGRGAWWDRGRSILHLGDQLIVDGEYHPLTVPLDSRNYYQRGSEMKGLAGAAPLSVEAAFEVLTIAQRFHWEIPASGLLLAGWVVLAPICGALPWRPHIWITAAAGSGKSAVQERYVVPLLTDMALIVVGNTSEAGIRQTLKSDALPVVMDEAEANEKADQVRIQNILSLARVASSDSRASTVKGSTSGEATRFKVRSMFMLSSIATSLKQGADQRRFAVLALRPPHDTPEEDRIAHWKSLDADLDKLITEDFARRLIARTVSLLPVVLESVKVFREVAAKHFGNQALGDQYGTLLGGAWMLSSDEAPTAEQAQSMIDATDWEPYRQSVEVPDERKCLQAVIEHTGKVEVVDRGPVSIATRSVERSKAELVDIVTGRQRDEAVSPECAATALARSGLRVVDGFLCVSNTAKEIGRILADTAWRTNWAAMLSRLPGAERRGPMRFQGLGARTRAVAVPLTLVQGAEEAENEGAVDASGGLSTAD